MRSVGRRACVCVREKVIVREVEKQKAKKRVYT